MRGLTRTSSSHPTAQCMIWYSNVQSEGSYLQQLLRTTCSTKSVAAVHIHAMQHNRQQPTAAVRIKPATRELAGRLQHMCGRTRARQLPITARLARVGCTQINHSPRHAKLLQHSHSEPTITTTAKPTASHPTLPPPAASSTAQPELHTLLSTYTSLQSPTHLTMK